MSFFASGLQNQTGLQARILEIFSHSTYDYNPELLPLLASGSGGLLHTKHSTGDEEKSALKLKQIEPKLDLSAMAVVDGRGKSGVQSAEGTSDATAKLGPKPEMMPLIPGGTESLEDDWSTVTSPQHIHGEEAVSHQISDRNEAIMPKIDTEQTLPRQIAGDAWLAQQLASSQMHSLSDFESVHPAGLHEVPGTAQPIEVPSLEIRSENLESDKSGAETTGAYLQDRTLSAQQMSSRHENSSEAESLNVSEQQRAEQESQSTLSSSNLPDPAPPIDDSDTSSLITKDESIKSPKLEIDARSVLVPTFRVPMLPPILPEQMARQSTLAGNEESHSPSQTKRGSTMSRAEWLEERKVRKRQPRFSYRPSLFVPSAEDKPLEGPLVMVRMEPCMQQPPTKSL